MSADPDDTTRRYSAQTADSTNVTSRCPDLSTSPPGERGGQELFRALEAVARLGVDDHRDSHATADAIIELARQALGGEHGRVALLANRGRLENLAANGPIAEQDDLWQDELQHGPSMTAVAEGRAVVCNNIAGDPRWPRWGPRAAALGVNSVLAVSLSLGERSLGVLSLYALAPQAYTTVDRDHALIFAVHASTALLWARERDNLRSAIDGRTQIGQAQGVLMARFGLDAQQSFAALRRYSQDTNHKLRDIAATVIETGDLPARRTDP